MKKAILTACAFGALVLAGCTRTEVTEMPENRAISFSDMYVGNATKAFTDIDDDQLKSEGQGFYVFGGNTENENLFNGEHVTYSNDTWVYDNIQYWTQSTYKFAAYAPKADGAITPTWSYESGQISLSVTSNHENQNDLIYDKADEITVNDGQQGSQQAVSFEFDHILSQIVIKFNSKLGDKIKLEVTNLKINGKIATTGTYDGTEDGNWNENSAAEAIDWNLDPITIEATDEDGAGESRILVIPQTPDGDITLKFDLKATNTIENQGGPWERKDVSVVLPNTNNGWSKGYVYTYTADINSTNLEDMYPINFAGTVSTDWTNGSEGNAGDVTIPDVE